MYMYKVALIKLSLYARVEEKEPSFLILIITDLQLSVLDPTPSDWRSRFLFLTYLCSGWIGFYVNAASQVYSTAMIVY